MAPQTTLFWSSFDLSDSLWVIPVPNFNPQPLPLASCSRFSFPSAWLGWYHPLSQTCSFLALLSPPHRPIFGQTTLAPASLNQTQVWLIIPSKKTQWVAKPTAESEKTRRRRGWTPPNQTISNLATIESAQRVGLEWPHARLGSRALPEARLGGGGNGKLVRGEVAACGDRSLLASCWDAGRRRSAPGHEAGGFGTGEPAGIRWAQPGI